MKKEKENRLKGFYVKYKVIYRYHLILSTLEQGKTEFDLFG
jgi:hypothetical protein